MTMIGIYGGTFDPVHNGHLALARAVWQALPLERIVFIPAGRPPHREGPSASGEARLAMLQAVLQNEPNFGVDTLELESSAPSWTLETLKVMHQRDPDAVYVLLMGTDAFSEFETWHEWPHIPEYCHLAVVTRPGHDLHMTPPVAAFFRHRQVTNPALLAMQPHGSLYHVQADTPDVSSTEVRRRLAQGEDTHRLLPPVVEAMVKAHHWYT